MSSASQLKQTSAKMVLQKNFNRLQIGKNDQMGKSCHTLFCRMLSGEPDFLFHFQMPYKVYFHKKWENIIKVERAYYTRTSAKHELINAGEFKLLADYKIAVEL